MISLNSMTASLSRLTGGLAAPVLALGLTMGAAIGGCELDRRPIGSPADGGGDGGMGGDGGTGGDGGMGGDGGSGGVLVSGSQYVPTPLRPSDMAILPPTRAFLLWQNAEIPAGRSVANYELCNTSGPSIEIDDAALCPNSLLLSELFRVMDPLAPDTTYRWKIRARYESGDYSEWSVVRPFSSDNSIVGWWLLNGNADDAGAFSHDGTLLGGASFVAGFIGQGLSLDGTDGSMSAADTGDHDFGTSDFTLTAWVHPGRDGVAEALIAKRSATNGYELYRTGSGQLAFYGGNCGIAATGGSLPMGAWHRVVAVRSAGMVFLYIDDALIGTGACADNFSNAADLTLGCDGADLGCAEPFQGLMDEVSVRNAASDESIVINGYCADLSVVSPAGPLPAACQP